MGEPNPVPPPTSITPPVTIRGHVGRIEEHRIGDLGRFPQAIHGDGGKEGLDELLAHVVHERVRGDAAGTYHIAAHPTAGILDGDVLGKADDGRLRQTVMPRETDQDTTPPVEADVHDGNANLPQQAL